MTYLPALAGIEGKKASEYLTHYNVIKMNEDRSKMERSDALFDKPHLWNEIVPGSKSTSCKTPQMDLVVNVHKVLGKGGFFGNKCKEHATELFSADAIIDNDMENPNEYFKKYPGGIDGVCEYFARSYWSAMHNLTASMYPRGDDVVLVLNYVPGITGLKKTATEPMVKFVVVGFDESRRKVASWDIFYSKPWLFDVLTSDDDAKSFVADLMKKGQQ